MKRKRTRPKPVPIDSHRVIFRLFSDRQLQAFPEAFPGDEVECYRCGKDHELSSAVAVKRTKKPDAMFLIYRCRGRWEIGAIFGKLIAGRLPDKEVCE
jgi:hypothetical protein